MKNICILVPETAVLAAITDPRYMFTAVNQFLEAAGKPALFTVQLVGLTKEIHLQDGLFTVHVDKLLSEVGATDLIVIPAISGDIQTALAVNQAFIPWIVDKYNNGSEVASLCIGAFLLASTGLLRGRKCSTHWLYANEFRTMFPDIELVDGNIINEVMFEVGYSDTKAFRDVFKRITGLTPIEYRNKYNKQAMAA